MPMSISTDAGLAPPTGAMTKEGYFRRQIVEAHQAGRHGLRNRLFRQANACGIMQKQIGSWVGLTASGVTQAIARDRYGQTSP